MSLEERIIKFIEDAEEHPTMEELLRKFITHSRNDIYFLRLVCLLEDENQIIYDYKHDTWFLPTPAGGDYITLSTKRRENNDK